MIFRFVLALGALDAERGEILAQPRQRALVQEPGNVVGAVGHQFAAADADEQIEKFALDFRGVGAARRFRETDMRGTERRRIAAQRGQPLQKFRIRRTRQQRRQQRVFLRAGKIDLIDAAHFVVLVVKIGPQDRARDTGQCLDRQHPLGGDARPIRHRRLGNPNAPRKLGDATGCVNRFLESPIWHVVFFLARSLSFF